MAATVFPIYQVADTLPVSLHKASDEWEALRQYAEFHPIFEYALPVDSLPECHRSSPL